MTPPPLKLLACPRLLRCCALLSLADVSRHAAAITSVWPCKRRRSGAKAIRCENEIIHVNQISTSARVEIKLKFDDDDGVVFNAAYVRTYASASIAVDNAGFGCRYGRTGAVLLWELFLCWQLARKNGYIDWLTTRIQL